MYRVNRNGNVSSNGTKQKVFHRTKTLQTQAEIEDMLHYSTQLVCTDFDDSGANTDRVPIEPRLSLHLL